MSSMLLLSTLDALSFDVLDLNSMVVMMWCVYDWYLLVMCSGAREIFSVCVMNIAGVRNKSEHL